MAERQVQHGDEHVPMTLQATLAQVPSREALPEPSDEPDMIRIPVTILIRLPGVF